MPGTSTKQSEYPILRKDNFKRELDRAALNAYSREQEYKVDLFFEIAEKPADKEKSSEKKEKTKSMYFSGPQGFYSPNVGLALPVQTNPSTFGDVSTFNVPTAPAISAATPRNNALAITQIVKEIRVSMQATSTLVNRLATIASQTAVPVPTPAIDAAQMQSLVESIVSSYKKQTDAAIGVHADEDSDSGDESPNPHDVYDMSFDDYIEH
jgi:hypothetical protein